MPVRRPGNSSVEASNRLLSDGRINYCRKCYRVIKDPNAIYGPKCWSRLRGPVAALQRSGNRAAEGAAQLLLDGALVRLRGHGGRVFATVSADGERTYLSAPEACNCRGGLYSKLCKHSTAVTILISV